MKLYQALKEKNKLSGEVKQLEALIQQKNSRSETEVNLFDVAQLLNELSEKRKKLIELKTKISQTNNAIQGKIYELSELKAEAAFYARLSTKQGVFVSSGYGNTTPQTFVTHLNEKQVAEIKKGLQDKIEKVQEELDYFNHTTNLQ
jgi:Tfp pilus assembly pilus retraction ATPase PilT